MERYGIDKPDTRFGLELVNLNETVKDVEFAVFKSALEANGHVKGMNIKGQATAFSRKKIDLITSTKEMSDFCVEKYPDLKKAGMRRLIYAYMSTLSQLANSSVKDIEVQKDLMKFIRKNGMSVLLDPRSKNRDKLGIVSTFFGFNFYKFIWNFYRKLTGRI
jgi:aspartyl-tRNA synthetase